VYRVIVIVRQQYADVGPDYFPQPLELICRPVREMLSRSVIDPAQNRLKLLKRQMYGRAKFDLLRARVLHQG
jgi:hypothetical protein